MVHGTTTKKLRMQAPVYILLILGGLMFSMPFFWMLSTSLKGMEGLFSIPPELIPKKFIWENYKHAVESFPILRYTLNTLIITVGTVVGTVFSSSLVAYSFAKLRWPGRDQIFVLLLSTMMLPGLVTLIPVFILFKHIGWVNTYLPLIVPAFTGSAFFTFLLRQFFKTIPMELSEAARMDGCSEFYIYSKIMLPLSRPAIITVAIFTFMGAWSDFFGPLIYLNDAEKFTLALGLRAFQMQSGTRWNVMMAASVIVLMPTLILFFTCQRYFIEGVTLTGIKG